MVVMAIASYVFVGLISMDAGGHAYGWTIALAGAANIWVFRYVFVPEGRPQWPAASNPGVRMALNLSLCALAVQNPLLFDWLYRRMYPPETSAFIGWAFILSLPIVAVALSLRALVAQVHIRGKHTGTAALASALSCWAAILAFGLVREASS
jgi:hypothetical protein